MTKETKFEWDEKYIKEFILSECNKYNTWDEEGLNEYLEKFKQSKELHKGSERIEDIETEIKKCKESPYYFYTKYFTVNGKPATTIHNEEDFNNFFKNGELDTKPSPDTLREGKDWEILSFKNRMGDILHRHHDGVFGMYYGDENILINSPQHEIHSVKRLSDNEVFAIGDKVNYGVIEKMIISWVGLEIQFVGGSGATLASIEKIKSPEPLTNTVTDNSDVVCLSLNDFSIWYERWYPNNPMKAAFLHGLKELVKQKLKQ